MEHIQKITNYWLLKPINSIHPSYFYIRCTDNITDSVNWFIGRKTGSGIVSVGVAGDLREDLITELEKEFQSELLK
jgi:hypothetical protein